MSKNKITIDLSSPLSDKDDIRFAYSINSDPRESALDYLAKFCQDKKLHNSDQKDSKKEEIMDDDLSEKGSEGERRDDDLFFGDFDDADHWKQVKTPDRSVSPVSQEKLNDKTRGLS